MDQRLLRRLCAGLFTIGSAGLLVACASSGAGTVATCLDDSAGCVSKRKATLTAMLGDPQRAWVSEPPSPQVYATGVRLFAWRRSRQSLSCGELKTGIAETAGARKLLANRLPNASRTRVGQIIALSDDVNGELKMAARAKRCA
ncbi:MAG: hypothetical protein AAFQ42_04155 [Pseudomonadota bacterium]